MLVEMAGDPTAGTPAERDHAESCEFCKRMIELPRKPALPEISTAPEGGKPEPDERHADDGRAEEGEARYLSALHRLREYAVPVGMAACLVLGFAIGSVVRPAERDTAQINRAWQVQHELAELARPDKASGVPAGPVGDQPTEVSEDRVAALRRTVGDLADRLGHALEQLQD